tara:strand:+ start:639 stop:1385 length:747 start_codon:yes stop_codon:yes gene_type:complete
MLGLGGGCHNATEVGFHDQGSINFDGSNDYVQVDNLAGVLATAFLVGEANQVNFTISAWVKLETMSTSGIIFQTRVGTSDHMNLFYHGSGNQLRWLCKFGGVAETCADSASGYNLRENDGVWYHLVGTATHGGNAELWLNGAKADSEAIANPLSGTLSTANIGGNTAETNFWNGTINDVGIWTRCLTDDEIGNIYRNKTIDLAGALGTNLVGYYRFEEKAGTTAINHADTTNNGTLTNSPTYSTETQG